jgi:ribulose-5-phosphate 4-epimerase/fuculose-1-phosphate aldolase
MGARRFYVISGGTMVHVAPHFSLCAPAYGKVGYDLEHGLEKAFMLEAEANGVEADHEVHLIRTKMAFGREEKLPGEAAVFKGAGIPYLETNEDLLKVIDYLVRQPETKGIVLAVAVCDWQPAQIDSVHLPQEIDRVTEFGKKTQRLRTLGGQRFMWMDPTDKLIGKVRQARKDIFLVGFKATTGQSEQEQYITGLHLLKNASCNLVLANDVQEHRNMVITPEEAKYHVTKDRAEAIEGLCQMIVMRSELHFTRSTVVEGDPIPWDGDEIPENLRAVVDHCIKRGAYKPFQGKTVGHFATRGPKDGIIYTSRRKSDFNKLAKDGLLRIDTVGADQVIAHGAKPSVGGQSQRIIFDQHPDVDCIVHAHVPLRPIDEREDNGVGVVPVREQRPYECGSHECGRNTSEGLREFQWVPGVLVRPGGHPLHMSDEDHIKVVMLDEHGPNICFSRTTNPDLVIELIERHWDLEAKTGGPVSLEAPV